MLVGTRFTAASLRLIINTLAINADQFQDTRFTPILLDAATIRTNLGHLNGNIPTVGAYSCTEGKLLAQLLAGNSILLQSQIEALQTKANTVQVEAAAAAGEAFNESDNVTAGKIKLIVLHIGTKMDPCAICTRNLVGLSKNINYTVDAQAHLGAGINAKFLVEVSSNGHYATAGTQNDNYASHYGRCSHTECAGHDNNHANLANIALNNIASQSPPMPCSSATLAIPHGIPNNWVFDASFPPYIIFGRTDQGNGNILNAPVFNQHADEVSNICGNINPQGGHHGNGGGDRRHVIRNNLTRIN